MKTLISWWRNASFRQFCGVSSSLPLFILFTNLLPLALIGKIFFCYPSLIIGAVHFPATYAQYFMASCLLGAWPFGHCLGFNLSFVISLVLYEALLFLRILPGFLIWLSTLCGAQLTPLFHGTPSAIPPIFKHPYRTHPVAFVFDSVNSNRLLY